MQAIRQLIGFFNPVRLLRWMLWALGTWRRKRVTGLDYVLLNVPPSMPPLPEPRNWI